MFADLVSDLRLALRSLRTRPLFFFIVLATLAVGIGANAAMFSVVDSVLLEPLHYPSADRLVWVSGRTPEGRPNTISALNYLDYRESATSFDELAAYLAFADQYVVTGPGEPEVLVGTRASWNLFRALGLAPVLGRDFTPADETPSSAAVVVISRGLWQRRFGGAPDVVGRTLALDGTPYEVVGVMPEAADRPADAELWRPMRLSDPVAQGRGNDNFRVFGRLRDGMTLERAEGEMQAVAAGIAERFPDVFHGWTVSLEPLQDVVVGDVRAILWLLMSAVVLVLLIACANLAALMLARAATREREVALRFALGASGSRVVRQLLTESVTVAVTGGMLGFLFAWGALEALRTLGAGSLPRLGEVGLDGSAVAFTAFVSLLTGVLLGMAPALRTRRAALADCFTGGSGSRLGPGGRRLQAALVVGQVALSLALLAGAGLLLRSFQQLRRVELGFQPTRVLTSAVRLPREAYREDRPTTLFWNDALERIRALPGVQAASITTQLPVDAGFGPWNYVHAEGREPSVPAERRAAVRRFVAPGYFGTMNIPLMQGRDLTAHDVTGTTPVTVISQRAAEELWPGEDPLGRGLMLWDTRWEVVGVVGDVRLGDLSRDHFPTFYLALRQVPQSGHAATLVVRAAGNPTALAAALRQAVRAVEPDAAMVGVATMASLVSASLATERLRTLLLGSFAGAALLLAALGLYGVLAYFVGERTHELGVRMALGANRINVLNCVLRRGLGLAAIGIAIGVAIAAVGSQVMRRMLFGVTALDPTTFAVTVAVLCVVSFLAAFVPAWRATQLHPASCMRAE